LATVYQRETKALNKQ